jgi:uncharacterized protein with ParB-like and HNH nuclease domain
MRFGVKIMDTSASNRRLRVLLTAIGNGSLVPQPEFQRRLVWINKDKVEFIRTVVEGYPFPEIYIAAGKLDPKTGIGTEVLVDGQQRITTLYQYFKDNADLKLPDDLPKYSDLKEDKQIAFLEYSVVVRDLGAMELSVIKDVFQRINSTSYGLNAMEIDNARYGGEFKKFGEKISTKDFFNRNKIFTATDIKRMNDVRYCLGLVITMMTTYFNRDKEIEQFLEKYNEAFLDSDKIESEFDTVLKFIDLLNFNPSSRSMKKADFYTLFIEMHRLLIKNKKDLSPVDVRKKLDDFYEQVDFVAEGNYKGSDDRANVYYKAALQASNDRANRILRGKIISSLFEST